MQNLRDFAAQLIRDPRATRKAWAAGITTAAVDYLGDTGLDVPDDVQSAGRTLIAFIIGAGLAWLLPNAETPLDGQ